MALTPEAPMSPISPNPPAGSTVTASYMHMEMPVYPVPESVAQTMGTLTWLAAFFFTLGGLTASVPIGIYISELFIDNLTTKEQTAINLTFYGFLIVTIIFAYINPDRYRSRQTS